MLGGSESRRARRNRAAAVKKVLAPPSGDGGNVNEKARKNVTNGLNLCISNCI